MRVAAVELAPRWADAEGALVRVDGLLADAGVDLALLPEASLTGYVSPRGDFDLSRFAEPLDGPTARALAALARRHETAVAGPLIERDGGRLFNALVVFDASGELVLHYRKRHPWYPETWATPGDRAAPVVTVAGLRVTVAICFDVHFLEAEAAASLDAADFLLFPSAWVEAAAGEDARADLLPSLAGAHRVAIVNANWGPCVPRLPGQGASRIVGADGRVIASASRPGDQLVCAELREEGVLSSP